MYSYRLGNTYADIPGVPGVCHIRTAHAECKASQGSGHTSVRVGSGNHLAGERQVFDYGVVTNRMGALTAIVLNLAIQFDVLSGDECLLYNGKLSCLLT